jgi:predicted ATP-grasp superfamily ATP-dependent carboligase
VAGAGAGRRWLVKPRAGAGGIGVRRSRCELPAERRAEEIYLQEWIPGPALSAAYEAGAGGAVRLYGITRQLVAEPDLLGACRDGRRDFVYCGSIGPLRVSSRMWRRFEYLGRVAARAFSLRGWFGVDVVQRGAWPVPLEINPRFTASVEVLDRARTARDGGGAPRVHGKAVLYASRAYSFGGVAHPHLAAGCAPAACADIPGPGTPIVRGQPLLTVLAAAASVPECRSRLLRDSRRIRACLEPPPRAPVAEPEHSRLPGAAGLHAVASPSDGDARFRSAGR